MAKYLFEGTFLSVEGTVNRLTLFEEMMATGCWLVDILISTSFFEFALILNYFDCDRSRSTAAPVDKVFDNVESAFVVLLILR